MLHQGPEVGRITRKQHSNIEVTSDVSQDEIDRKLNVDALLMLTSFWPPAGITQRPANDFDESWCEPFRCRPLAK